MRLPYKEPTAPRYIYINPKTNKVHLLMPIMSGTEIGLDNTCKSVYSLQEFFGIFGENKQNTALGALTNYKNALVLDLKFMPDSEEKTRKADRLSQINKYLEILNQVQQDTRITEPLKKSFPLYPEPLVHLMETNDANLHSVILRPRKQDNYLRMTAIEPTFSAHHNQMVNGQLIPHDSQLASILSQHYQNIQFIPKSMDGLIALVVSKRVGLPVDFDEIKAQLIHEIKTYLGIDVSFEQTQSNQAKRAAGSTPSVPMNKLYLDQQLAPETTEEYINGLIYFCTPNLFDNIEGSPFYTVSNSENLSILTQFFLAELNIACREQGITADNFGLLLENDSNLIKDLAITVKQALEHSSPVEETLVQYINQNQARFGLTTLISEESVPIATLKERFKSHWEQIKDSPHFDEFMLLGEKSGLFVTHQGCMATHFANFILAGWQNNCLDTSIQDFDTVDKPNNVIPHKNAHIHAEIKEFNIDLSQMDNNALQSLYVDIKSYPDITLKEALLTQFSAERPDFKPTIDAKQFLQHVAYGEQDEAETLLQLDPELAQALLMAYDIPFTDYSGRTFKCTAYEYAYWAKDTHMQRMLEKYIRINEETRQLILDRVQEIEKLVHAPAPHHSFGLFQPAPIPQGLHYTKQDKQDKQGQITEHQDAGFDLTPLITAISHCLDEYEKRKDKLGGCNETDWIEINKIWIEEVGRAQRDIPAHIAHEYCNPDRNFIKIAYNKISVDHSRRGNLIRQLRYEDNYVHRVPPVWFSDDADIVDNGLGVSFAIFSSKDGDRTGRPYGGPLIDFNIDETIFGLTIDAKALTVISETRTKERNQSLLNLSQGLSPQP